MNAWLKGGLIGAILFGLITFLAITDIINISESIALPTFNSCKFITSCAGEDCMGCLVLSPIIGLVYGFIMGAIIGLIVGRIKQEK